MYEGPEEFLKWATVHMAYITAPEEPMEKEATNWAKLLAVANNRGGAKYLKTFFNRSAPVSRDIEVNGVRHAYKGLDVNRVNSLGKKVHGEWTPVKADASQQELGSAWNSARQQKMINQLNSEMKGVEGYTPLTHESSYDDIYNAISKASERQINLGRGMDTQGIMAATTPKKLNSALNTQYKNTMRINGQPGEGWLKGNEQLQPHRETAFGRWGMPAMLGTNIATSALSGGIGHHVGYNSGEETGYGYGLNDGAIQANQLRQNDMNNTDFMSRLMYLFSGNGDRIQNSMAGMNQQYSPVATKYLGR